MKLGVSEIAQIFEVEKAVVKLWARDFAEYLNPEANPKNGNPREFLPDDLRVLAFISLYWEDEPDYQNIWAGLNTNCHFEQPFNDLVTENKSFFQDLPENLDEDWRHGTVLGGMSEIGDTYSLAKSYKLAGDILVEAALASDDVRSLICPIIYNYRHATELYLKAIIPNHKKDHDLNRLLKAFDSMAKSKFKQSLPKWFENIVGTFNDFDPKSTTFRYGNAIGDERWIDIAHIKIKMDWFAEAFQRIDDRYKLFPPF